MWETTTRQLAKGEWKFRVASKIHFILAGLATGACYDFYFFSEYSKNHKGGI